MKPNRTLFLRSRWLKLLPFVVFGLLLYSNTLEVPFYFDDLPNIQQNPLIRLTKLTFTNITKAAFKSPCSNRPIANISFALNYYFHQYNVVGYHITNITIHVLTGILLYFFLEATLTVAPLQSRYQRHSSIALFAALLWLVHPIQTQSVTYVVQRMNSMAAMFYILSFLLYVKGRLVKESQKSWPWFSGCVLAGLLALGSKEIAATLPFFILLYEWYFFQDLSRAWLKRHLPHMIGAMILLGLLAFWYLGFNPLENIQSGYRHRDFTLSERVLTEFRVVIYYISLLLYPHPSRLNLDYDFPLSRSFIDPIMTLFSVGTIVVMIGLAIWMAKKDRLASFCILWFLGNLAIESSVIGLEIIYEHRTYLPSMFFFLVIVVLAGRYVRRDRAIAGVLSGAILLLCLWTYERNSLWRDPLAFAKDCAEKAPKKGRCQDRLGVILAQQGKLAEAIVHYREALRLRPNDPSAHNNLGVALAEQGKPDEAMSHYKEALQIMPGYAEAHNNLGILLAEQGKLDEAVACYRQALRIRADYEEAHNRLGAALAELGRLDEAIAHFSEAVQINPEYGEGHYNLGLTLARQGHSNEAMAHYRKAIQFSPGYAEAHNNLGILLAKSGKLGEAIAHFSEAVQINPNYSEAARNLKKAAAMGKRIR